MPSKVSMYVSHTELNFATMRAQVAEQKILELEKRLREVLTLSKNGRALDQDPPGVELRRTKPPKMKQKTKPSQMKAKKKVKAASEK